MKLSDDNIRFVDNWLRFSGIEYIDVRYELLDHLVSEYEQSNQEISLDRFVRKRLKWCKDAAKKKENAVHWAVQKNLLRRFVSLFEEWRVLLSLLVYILSIFFLKDRLSFRTVRFLLFTPIFLTIIVFTYQSVVNRFSKERREQHLGAMKLGTLFALPHIFFSFFYFPEIWSVDHHHIIDNFHFIAPYTFLITVLNIAAILEYQDYYKIISKEFEILRKQ